MALSDDVRHNAELFRALIRDSGVTELAYSRKSVFWLNGYIDRYVSRQRDKGEEIPSNAVDMMASFFGECLRETYGGDWEVNPEHGLMLRLGGNSIGQGLFPKNNILNQIAEGSQSRPILGVFDSIASLMSIGDKPIKRIAYDLPVFLDEELAKLDANERKKLNISITLPPAQAELTRLFEISDAMLDGGRTVWGAVVQANEALTFFGGNTGGFAHIIYSPENDIARTELEAIAKQCYAWKGKQSANPAIQAMADLLKDEKDMRMGVACPLAPTALMSATFLSREHMLGGVYAMSHFPVLINDKYPGYVRLLPHRFWPEKFKAEWNGYVQLLAKIPHKRAEPEAANIPELYRLNAQKLRNNLIEDIGLELNYNEEGMATVDKFLVDQRVRGNPENKGIVISSAACFYGECLRETCGGRWEQDSEQNWGIRVGEHHVNPFQEVEAIVQTASAPTLAKRYASLREAHRNRLKSHTSHAKNTAKRPWWKFW